jgi:hypothetical protein
MFTNTLLTFDAHWTNVGKWKILCHWLGIPILPQLWAIETTNNHGNGKDWLFEGLATSK